MKDNKDRYVFRTFFDVSKKITLPVLEFGSVFP